MSQKIPTIMVIEDEALLVDAITRKLSVSNLNVITTASGKDALTKLKQASELPDAIWLDYYLKDMDGLEFMKELKKDARLSQIPVVVVSNSASPEKIHNMLAIGAKKYILKAEHRLDDIIRTVLEFVQTDK